MTTILIKKKDTAGAPAAGDLTNAAGGAEIAVNTATKRIYTKDSGGNVVEVGTNPTATTMNGNLTFVPDATYDIGASGVTRPRNLFLSGAATLGTALTVPNGGTGLTTLATGSLSYGAGTSAFSTLAIGTAGQFLTSTGTAPQWSTLSGVAVTTFSAGTTGFTPNTATSGAITLAGTLATTNGGTGLTSFTSGGVVYASSTSALATGSALTFNGTSFGVGSSSYGDAGTITASIGVPSTTVGGLQLWSTTAGTHYVHFGDGTTGSDTYRGYVGYSHSSDALIFGTTSTERARIDSSGRLLIGGTSTYDFNGQANLVVNGTSNLATITVASTTSGYIAFADGTTGTDRYAGSIEYSHTNNRMTFGTNGVFNLVSIDSSGNFGVNTTSPAAKLDVRDVNKIVDGIGNVFFATTDSQAADKGASLSLGGAYVGSASLYPFAAIAGRKTNSTSTDASGYLAMYTTNASNTIVERMRIISSGAVGIGTSTPAGAFTIGGSGALQQYFISTSATSVANAIVSLCNNASSYSNLSHDALDYSWSCSGTARFSIQGSGILTSLATYNNTSAGVANMFVQTDGTFYRGGVSALKYKQDVRDLELIDINKFRAVRYKSKCEMDDQTIDYFGIIADEVDAAGIKELVVYGADGEVESFMYERLTVVLLKNLQSQKATIESLKARLDAANL
jgi:hypothetical protein